MEVSQLPFLMGPQFDHRCPVWQIALAIVSFPCQNNNEILQGMGHQSRRLRCQCTCYDMKKLKRRTITSSSPTTTRSPPLPLQQALSPVQRIFSQISDRFIILSFTHDTVQSEFIQASKYFSLGEIRFLLKISQKHNRLNRTILIEWQWTTRAMVN